MNVLKHQINELRSVKKLYPWAKYLFRNNEKYSLEPSYLLCVCSTLPISKDDHFEISSDGFYAQLPNALKWVTFRSGIICIDDVIKDYDSIGVTLKLDLDRIRSLNDKLKDRVQTKKVYVIQVVYNEDKTSSISQEGYSNLLLAQKEIESKQQPNMKKINPFLYMSDEWSYFIWETIIK